MRFSRSIALVVSLAAPLVLSACTVNPSGADSRVGEGSLEASPALVSVPNVLAAIEAHSFATSYESDPEGAANEVVSFAESVIESAGLTPEVELQPITLDDTQSPVPNSELPAGGQVRVRIGFGD